MSYDIYLCDPITREAIEVEAPHLMQGGTYALGGTTELWLNVTYNYGRHYRRVSGRTAAKRSRRQVGCGSPNANSRSERYFQRMTDDSFAMQK